jgi:hypothetical protein
MRPADYTHNTSIIRRFDNRPTLSTVKRDLDMNVAVLAAIPARCVPGAYSTLQRAGYSPQALRNCTSARRVSTVKAPTLRCAHFPRRLWKLPQNLRHASSYTPDRGYPSLHWNGEPPLKLDRQTVDVPVIAALSGYDRRCALECKLRSGVAC